MKINKKYIFLIQFIKIFSRFSDCDDLVDISESDYNLLREFALALNVYPSEYIQPDNQNNGSGVQGPQGPQGPQGESTSVDLENYASKDYVDEKITEIVDGAPEMFNTLKKISNWIGDHEDSIDLPSNIVTSNVEGLKIDVVGAAPENPDENTLYVIQ